MKNLADRLENLGVERRFALDIGSVVLRIRPRGLLHVSTHLKQDLGVLLRSYGLRIEASRELYRRHDSTSREGVLSEYSSDDLVAEKWSEVWYANPAAAVVGQTALFINPGKFLGYPKCCRRAMTGKDALARLYRRYLFEEADRYWELNRLAALFHDAILMPDFFPCSMGCASAQRYVVPFHQVASQVFSESELAEARNAMLAPMTIIAGEVVQWRHWRCVGDLLCVKSDGARKEALSRVSSFLPSRDESSAHLVSFKHLLAAGHEAVPCILRIEAEGYEMTEIPLILV